MEAQTEMAIRSMVKMDASITGERLEAALAILKGQVPAAPEPAVQSIVGHTSTAMTRHYYHENEAELRKAVAAIPSVAQCSPGEATSSSLQNKELANSIGSDGDVASPHTTVAERLALLEELKAKGLVTPEEYATQRQRILSEI